MLPTKAEIDAAAKTMGITGSLTTSQRIEVADTLLWSRELALIAAASEPPPAPPLPSL